MAEFEQTMRMIAICGFALFCALFLLRLWWARRNWRQRRRFGQLPMAVQGMQILAITAWSLFAAGLLLALFVLQRGTFFMAPGWQAAFAVALLAWVVLEIVLSLRMPPPRRPWRWLVSGIGLVIAGGIGAIYVLGALAAFKYPPAGEGVVLARLPFEGEWVATGAGATLATNHHARIPSQQYAADLAALCADGRLFRGDGMRQEDSCTFGAKVLSPVDGEVVHVRDGLADGGSREVLPGNHLVIRIDEGRYVALAHFRQGSVRVKPGDRVRAGQEIAQAGNSGNSDFAHLHIHVQDGPIYDLRESKAVPYRFAQMERRRYLWWSRVGDGFLLGNDRVRPVESPETR